LHCHQSQFYEWLPYNAGYLDQVPNGDEDRRRWLADRVGRRIQPLADRYRDLVIRTYGPERGARVRNIDAFEISEYGAPLDAEAWTRLFPFLPSASSAISPFTRKEWVDLPEAE
jgi:N-acetylglucosamine malate deacetylase 1